MHLYTKDCFPRNDQSRSEMRTIVINETIGFPLLHLSVTLLEALYRQLASVDGTRNHAALHLQE